MIAKDNSQASESGHWYHRATGKPMYQIVGKNGKVRNTNLKDAKASGDIAELLSDSHKIVDQPYWVRINQAEVAAGESRGKPRVKAVSIPDLLRLGQP